MSNQTISIRYYDIDERRERVITCDTKVLCELVESERSRQKENYTVIKKDIEFQLTDVPNALREHGKRYTGHSWEKAAQMQELWFSLPAREMSSEEKGGRSIIPKEYVLENYYSFEWLEQANTTNVFKDAVTRLLYGSYISQLGTYFTEISSCIYNKAALYALKNDIFGMNYSFYKKYNDSISFLRLSNIQEFHRLFQFQKVKLFDEIDKWKLVISFNALKDEFFATIAGSQLNAAIGKYHVEGKKITIKSVYIYIRDTFDFINKEGDQYLGHWNKYGFNIYFRDQLLGLNQIHDINKKLEQNLSKEDFIPIDIIAAKAETIFSSKPEDRWFPVKNSTYNAWRNEHKKGGDLLVFSEVKEFSCNISFILD